MRMPDQNGFHVVDRREESLDARGVRTDREAQQGAKEAWIGEERRGHDGATLIPDKEAAGAQVRQFHGVALVARAADVARALERPEVVT
jgi:hypothetical protein